MGERSAKVLQCAYLNAANETGFINPIDEAIRAHAPPDCSGWNKLDELPYDFVRKRLSILFEEQGRHVLITKGALRQILQVCSKVQLSDGSRTTIGSLREQIEQQWRKFSSQGCRVLGVASRDCDRNLFRITREAEADMTFLGFVVLSDPPKAGVQSSLRELEQLGIQLKIITGDNVLIASHLAREIGLKANEILAGAEIQKMSDSALLRRATEVDVFAEIEPGQKERLILALKKAGHVVGYIGDGINDASALHAADVSLSVDGAVDVAREAADFVLLEHDLEVLVDGVREGRRTFANTLKYVFIATSANFGNMFSMAGVSLFLPFLPLLPKQILLINLITDFPEMTIATDNVDPELTEQPRRWDVGFIRRFMIVFGLISSVFDYLTFGVLIWLNATVEQFRTGWFIESIVSAALIVLVVRSRRPLMKSQPSKLLALATAVVVIVAALMPHLPFSSALGFRPMPVSFYFIIAFVILAYVAAAELAKSIFYRREST
jgi:P-type Mg2+ transporter